MSIDRLFELIAQTRETADWRAAFGEPRQVEGVTLIPVAQVGRAFGLGFGQGTQPGQAEGDAAPSGEGGGGGGGATSRPLGTIVISQGQVSFKPTPDEGEIALASLAVIALALWVLSKTLRALFGRR